MFMLKKKKKEGAHTNIFGVIGLILVIIFESLTVIIMRRSSMFSFNFQALMFLSIISEKIEH